MRILGFVIAVIGVCILQIFDVSRFFWKFTPFTQKDLFFPTTNIIEYLNSQDKPYRIIVLDDRIMPPNTNAYYGIEAVSGYDPLYDARYEKYIAAMERGEPNILPPYGFNRIITPKNITSPLFPHLGVRYVLSLGDIPDVRVRKALQEGQTRVYEYLNVLPRAYLLEKVTYNSDEKQIFNTLYDPGFRIGIEGIIEEQVEIGQSPVLENERADITKYTDNKIEISVTTQTPRVLVIGNVYHKRWKAYVDGKQAHIYRVNYLFMGVVVLIGTHSVDIWYK